MWRFLVVQSEQHVIYRLGGGGGGDLMWMMPLHLRVNQTPDYDDDV